MTRSLRALLGVALAAVAVLTVAPPALAAPPTGPSDAVWHRCRDKVITWTVSIADGTKGATKAAEKRRIAKSLAAVSKASGGLYQFRYVPSRNLHIAWGSSPYGTPYEQVAVPYATDPRADLMFSVIPPGKPAPGGPTVYDFNGGFAKGLRSENTYTLADGTQENFRDTGSILLNAKRIHELPPTWRQKYYTWGALTALGLRDVATSATVNDRDRSLLRAAAERSCAAVASSPTITALPGSPAH